MSDDISADEAVRIDRRKMLTGLGVVGVASLAGCVDENGGADNDSEGEDAQLSPPEMPFDPDSLDDEYWAWVARANQYQNEALDRLLNE